MMKLATYIVGSLGVTVGIICNALNRYEQFFPACLYLATGKFNQIV